MTPRERRYWRIPALGIAFTPLGWLFVLFMVGCCAMCSVNLVFGKFGWAAFFIITALAYYIAANQEAPR